MELTDIQSQACSVAEGAYDAAEKNAAIALAIWEAMNQELEADCHLSAAVDGLFDLLKMQSERLKRLVDLVYGHEPKAERNDEQRLLAAISTSENRKKIIDFLENFLIVLKTIK